MIIIGKIIINISQWLLLGNRCCIGLEPLLREGSYSLTIGWSNQYLQIFLCPHFLVDSLTILWSNQYLQTFNLTNICKYSLTIIWSNQYLQIFNCPHFLVGSFDNSLIQPIFANILGPHFWWNIFLDMSVMNIFEQGWHSTGCLQRRVRQKCET